jgi:hypothetical protein
VDAALELLDARGGVSRAAGPGTGLVAATRVGEEEGISFFVTGVDAAGVEAAAAALRELERESVAGGPGLLVTLPWRDASGLHNAVALVADGRVELRLRSRSDVTVSRWGAQRQSDLFRRAFGRELEVSG